MSEARWTWDDERKLIRRLKDPQGYVDRALTMRTHDFDGYAVTREWQQRLIEEAEEATDG